MRAAQDSANAQSASNVVTFKQYFGPKMESLTGAIVSSSESSSFLSKVIIGVTIIGTLIAGLQWYSALGADPDFSAFSDKRLDCVVAHGEEQSPVMVNAIIEFCSRKFD